MVQQATQMVEGRDGLRGVVRQVPQSGMAEIELEDGRRILVPVSVLTRREDGSFLLPLSVQQLPTGHGQTSTAGTSAADMTDRGQAKVDTGQTVTVPVAHEELQISRVQKERGQVVVHVVPQMRRERVDVPLAEEQAEIERITVNRFVDAPEPIRQEGDVTILPVYEEVLVVERRLMVREEVRIRRTRTTRNEPQEVELRTEEVHVLRSEIPEDH